MNKQNNSHAGFTLIELLIVVTILGILAAVAYPSYQDHVRRANRAAAQQFLLELANRQEQHLLNSGAYASTLASLGYAEEPDEVKRFYTVTVALDAGPPPDYILTATPVAGSMQAEDGALSLRGSGAKTGKWD